MKELITTVLFTCFFSFGFSQIFGLWEVTNVSVGDQNLTPMAKWFHLHPNLSYEGGNGGLQNDEGTFTNKNGQLLFTNIEGITDEMGAFKYQLSGEQLTLNRKEEGMDIKVHLTKVRKKPAAIWDQIIGNWNLKKVTKKEEDITSTFTQGKNISYRFRWDRLYFRNENDNRASGVWFMHAHRIEVRLIPDNRNNEDEFWEISFPQKDKMEWRSKDGLIIQTFSK